MARTKNTLRHFSPDWSRSRAAEDEADRSAKQARLSNLSFTRTIEVLVGETRTKFSVHHSIISARSPFFDAALKKWKTAGVPITLSDDEPDLFDAYLESLYAGKITPHWNEVEDDFVETRRLIKLYILADKLGDLTSANPVIDRLMHYLYQWVPDLEDVLEEWHSTPPNSPLRLLLVDAFAMNTRSQNLARQLRKKECPEDFDVAINERLAGLEKVTAFRGTEYEYLFAKGAKCACHQHDEMHAHCEGGEVGDD
ncbi:hypothetical protein B0A55_03515 [Friedmanniomyces simplex]|uniref:BTB domain-containing protein n=1 Tax=Friedmanniomyces simplex TaxID=329884 RepID=A0A4U0XPR2_9PEZI|nr:hypothetical protein B0A55_03515 [Friedmanniomyces simplex]